MKLRKQNGQGMTEYIVILALIVVVAIAVLRKVGTKVQEKEGSIISSLR